MAKATVHSRFKLQKNLITNTVSMLWFDGSSIKELWTWPISEWTLLIATPDIIEPPEPVVEPVGDDHLLGLA